jgi:hypothetical protein
MADVFGKALAFVGASADHNELLREMYVHFAGGSDPNWSIKAGVTVPSIVWATGDSGFVLEDVATGTINIAIADHNGCGGVGVDGGALSTSDDLIVGIDPGGGITNITSLPFTVGARWSGWVVDCQGGTSTSLDGRLKISSGASWLSVRFKVGGAYTGGFFAGEPTRLSANMGDGIVLFGGAWADWYSTLNSDHKAIEVSDGVWAQGVTAYPSIVNGLTSPRSTDGAGAFRTTPLGIGLANTPGQGTLIQFSPEALFPNIWTSAQGAAGKGWSDGAAARNGYNPVLGCWTFKDTNGDAE